MKNILHALIGNRKMENANIGQLILVMASIMKKGVIMLEQRMKHAISIILQTQLMKMAINILIQKNAIILEPKMKSVLTLKNMVGKMKKEISTIVDMAATLLDPKKVNVSGMNIQGAQMDLMTTVTVMDGKSINSLISLVISSMETGLVSGIWTIMGSCTLKTLMAAQRFGTMSSG